MNSDRRGAYAWHRLLFTTLSGTAAALGMPSGLWKTRVLMGWFTGSLVYLGIVWWGVGRLDPAGTRVRATAYDPGNAALYALVVAASWVSLVGACCWSRTQHAA